MRTGIGNRRRRIARLACLVWLLAVVGLPALHEAHHAADHSHAADGAIVSHRHDAHGHHVSAERTTARRAPRQLAIDHPVEPGHQAGGVAHHAIALHQPEPPAIAPAPRVELERDAPILRSHASSFVAHPSARGPPART